MLGIFAHAEPDNADSWSHRTVRTAILGAIVVDVEKRLAIFVDRGDLQACPELEYGNPVEQDASVYVLLQIRCLGGRHPPNTAAVKQWCALALHEQSVSLLPGIFNVETCQ
jgi:hypothetical protein